jgi:hypothetical protein
MSSKRKQAAPKHEEEEKIPEPLSAAVEAKEVVEDVEEILVADDDMNNMTQQQLLKKIEDLKLELSKKNDKKSRRKPGTEVVHSTLRKYHSVIETCAKKLENSSSSKESSMEKVLNALMIFAQKVEAKFIQDFGEYIPDPEAALEPPKKSKPKPSQKRKVDLDDSEEHPQPKTNKTAKTSKPKS